MCNSFYFYFFSSTDKFFRTISSQGYSQSPYIPGVQDSHLGISISPTHIPYESYQMLSSQTQLTRLCKAEAQIHTLQAFKHR